MQKAITFLTNSRFEGNFTDSIHSMDGFGRYMYPDGSEYRGFFKRGKFHGYGRLRLSAPYNFTFIGEFDNGLITTIDELIYPDGLHMIATFSADGMNADKWRYCTEADRRYTTEIIMGPTPVGLSSCVTRFRTARHLRPNTYDTEEGIFIDSSGFVTQVQPPFSPQRFVECASEVEWIRKTYRCGSPEASDYEPVEPRPEIGRHIIDTNIAGAIKNAGDVLHPMTILDESNITKLCRELLIDNIAEHSDSSSGCPLLEYKTPPSTESTSSFSNEALRDEIDQPQPQPIQLNKPKKNKRSDNEESSE